MGGPSGVIYFGSTYPQAPFPICGPGVIYFGSIRNQLANVKSLAGEFFYGYDEANPALLTKMTGPAHEVETTYEPHRNLITGVVNRSRFAAEVGSRKSEVGGDAGAPVAPAPAADSGPSTKNQEPRTLSSYLYANDLLGRRETISQGGEAFGMLRFGANQVEVAYNDRSEVVGAAYRSGDEVRQRFGYDYDAIGNRQRAASEVGGRKSEVSYEVNALNQYAGIKTNSVNSVSFVGQPVHDLDGNLLEDARNTYTWNANNNLIRVDAKDGSLRLDYVYDYQSRRTVRTETTNPGKDTESRRTIYYLYDDWNLVADVSAITGDGSRVTGEEADAVRYYTWGRDLSGSLQGAGGVGGLLAISEGVAHRFPTYDANGNIGQLIDGAGSVVAAYAYDPFGNVTEMAGAEAAENPWRFSTKPVDAGTGWLYYGYRWYDAGNGRWPSRDPIEESGGVNLYGIVGNSSLGKWDLLGMAEWKLKASEDGYVIENEFSAILYPRLKFGTAQGREVRVFLRTYVSVSGTAGTIVTTISLSGAIEGDYQSLRTITVNGNGNVSVVAEENAEPVFGTVSGWSYFISSYMTAEGIDGSELRVRTKPVAIFTQSRGIPLGDIFGVPLNDLPLPESMVGERHDKTITFSGECQ